MPTVVLGAESPVHVWKHRLFFEVYCAKDTAAYFRFPSVDVESREKRGLSALSTFLAKKHGDFYTPRVKPMSVAYFFVICPLLSHVYLRVTQFVLILANISMR
jgi:hypothetical protein